MKILVVSYYDDNYGDMLIRICFTSILKIVLKNLEIPEESCDIRCMPLKVIDEEAVCTSDIIFFAGGALFGFNYENFFTSMERIIQLADEHAIPVVFSSMGANHGQASSENDSQLYRLLQKNCIRAISVRDNPAFFRKYCPNEQIPISQVCDPAVWTGYVYKKELPACPPHEKPVIGINVARGGLFRDNGHDWGLSDEVRYLDEIRQKLEEAGMDYRFYTNGSLLDNNTLRYFAEVKEVPLKNLLFNQTTRDLVHAIAGFDAVLAIRMHSSIISYSMGVPAVNLIWHEKIPLFYTAIGRPDRAIPLENWSADDLISRLGEFTVSLSEKPAAVPDPAYAMSLYDFLFDRLRPFAAANDLSAPPKPFSFEEITALLEKQAVPLEEDLTDLRRKVLGGERKYFGKFKESKKNEAQIKELQKELKSARKELDGTQKKLSQKEESLQKSGEKQKELEHSLKETKQSLKETKDRLKKAQADLDHINSHLSMRIYRKLKKLLS
ncbi:MAG: polysaccharide pyruvyl transferase family protein [Blautia sp.]|nr:polysaccharide pyruvyl transferase family protein [Blautia sp.]